MPVTKRDSANSRAIARADDDLKEHIMNKIEQDGNIITPNNILKAIKEAEKADIKAKAELEKDSIPDVIPKGVDCDLYNESYVDLMNRVEDKSIDLLLTDPPYSTDVENIESFAVGWLRAVLPKVKDTGRAFICIGAYPKELRAYLNILLNTHANFIVDAPLIWTYRNTLGQTPNMKYNMNYQIILHLYTDKSAPLDKSITNEMFSVQDINAPDGRHDGRLHAWQKPDELARRLIKHTTKKGDLILDPFACTGTFSLMAAKMERNSIGGDISLDNLRIAEKRGIRKRT